MLLRLQETSRSNQRYAVELSDGARVECVVYRGDTLCVSSQVGCAVACPFCASGAKGFTRNLSLQEMVGQLEHATQHGHALRRVTVSGVGEPLHNLDNVLEFIRHARSIGVKPSVTSSGGPLSRLPRLLREFHNGLTLSVHAGSEAVRKRAVPNGPSLQGLFDTLQQTLPEISANKRRKLSLAYLMVEGLNDRDAELDAFVERVLPLELTVHLYALNPTASSSLLGVSRKRYEVAYERMSARGLRVRMSSQARLELNGGCGTLMAAASAP